MVKAGKTKISAGKEVVLSGSLALRSAGEIRKQLLRAFEEADKVSLLFRDVEEVDLSLVQIICAAHHSAVRNGKTLTMQGSLPDAFTQVIDDAGLNGHISCSADARGCCVWQDC